MISEVVEGAGLLVRRLASVNDVSNSASNANEERGFVLVTVVFVAGFICCYCSALGIVRCFLQSMSDQQLRVEVARRRAQGEVVELRDLRKQKKKMKNAKRALSDEEEDDWYDDADDDLEDNMEVRRRTWFYSIYAFLTSVPVMAFVLMVVFVDLIVTFCSEVLLTPTEKQNKDVDIFGLVVVCFFAVELILRWYTYAYVKFGFCFSCCNGKCNIIPGWAFFCGSGFEDDRAVVSLPFCNFLTDKGDDPKAYFQWASNGLLNSIDVLVVTVDVLSLAIIYIYTSSHTDQASEYSGYIRAIRLLRIARLGRVVKAASVVARQMQDIEQAAADSYVEDLSGLPEMLTETMANKAVDSLEKLILDDLLDRGTRLEQHSWYHFDDLEKRRIERVYQMYFVSGGLHRMDVYAALRRFGCKVNISQARFLVQEFDSDATGVFSLKQFISICARAQVVAKYENSSAPEGSPPAAASKHRGLSMIEVRALVDVFDEIDEKKTKARQARDGTIFTEFPSDGLIDKHQLVTAIKNGGYNPTMTEISEYMKTYDPRGTGWITKQDFLIIMGRVPTSQGTFTTKQYAKIVQLFDMYDVDRSGLVSLVELKALMWRLDLNLRKGTAAVIIDRLFPTGQNTPLDKQTVVSILSHAKARRDQYVRGGVGVPETFSPVLDGAEVGEDLSRVPKVPPGVLTLSDRALVMETFEHFDSSGSGTIPRYLFKKCMRMLGFYQIDSASLDAVARKIPASKDGRMDFPEFFALIGFVMQNGKRGMYGDVVGTVFETPPDEPEAIEDVLAVVCEPTFLAQFTEDLSISLQLALPAIAAYVDEMVPSASCLYEWMDGVIRQGHDKVPLERFVEVIHDVGEQYYAEFDARARRFHQEQLYRWIGEAETRRCAEAFMIYTDKSSVLARAALEALLSDLGYPVTSHEDSKAVLKEFSHPKDKSTVLFPELLHLLKSLAVTRFKAEDGRGDLQVDARGIVIAAAGADGAEDGPAFVSPLHEEAVDEDALRAAGVAVEVSKGAGRAPPGDPSRGPGADKKKRAREAEAPRGGYMLVAKNLLKKKVMKIKAKDEVDEEGYTKPKSAYELFVLTNPTADQVELLNQWTNLMTDAEKNAFEQEANDMRKAYDDLKGGVVDKDKANDLLKRRNTGHAAKIKKGAERQVAAHGAPDLSAKALAATAAFTAAEEAEDADLPAEPASAPEVSSKAQDDSKSDASLPLRGPGAAAARMGAPLAVVQQPMSDLGVIGTHTDFHEMLAISPPPPAPAMGTAGGVASVRASAAAGSELVKHRSASIIVPTGLSSTGVPAELTMTSPHLDAPPAHAPSHIASSMPHIVGPLATLAPPPPPSTAGPRGSALSLPMAPQFAVPGMAMGGLPPPPPPAAFRR